MARNIVTVGKPWEQQQPFSRGVVVSGRLLYTSGIVARDLAGALVGVGDVKAQTLQCFANLGDILHAAGAAWRDVVQYTIYTTDIVRAQRASSEVVAKFCIAKPASTLVWIRSLVHKDTLVELEAVIALDR